jgi:DNA-binding MarR family transcriptional regulator
MSKRMAKKAPASAEAVADRLHSAAIHLLRLVRVQDTGTGVAPARLSALSVIVFGGPLSLNALARAEQVRPPTMSRIVDALQAAGMVHRKPDIADRRRVLIEATEKGIAILHQGRRRRVQFLVRRLGRLSSSQLLEIRRALHLLEKALQSDRRD